MAVVEPAWPAQDWRWLRIGGGVVIAARFVYWPRLVQGRVWGGGMGEGQRNLAPIGWGWEHTVGVAVSRAT